VSGAASYVVARLTSSSWSVVWSGSASSGVQISYRAGLTEYGLFAVMATGEAIRMDEFWTMR
jgi:hypothetical protein